MSLDTCTRVFNYVAERLRTARRPLIVGICGAQGSGKSWLVAELTRRLAEAGSRTCALPLDDLYLTREARAALARDVHPLLAVRGVPGTHDVTMGLDILDRLTRPGEVRLPSFDKAHDDRTSPQGWTSVAAPMDVVLFEGWCVGAVPQDEGLLAKPVNALEAIEDPDGRWRTYVNIALAGIYQDLFDRIDALVLLQAPSFDVVARWRLQQEETLRAALKAQGRSTTGLMDSYAVKRFISHYERLTRHIMTEMPHRADLVIRLDEFRRPYPVD